MTDTELDRLIKRVAVGDKKALEAIYNNFNTPVYYYVLRLLCNTDKAQDAMQETFLAIMRGSKSYTSEKKASAWIYTIAKNKAMDILRKEHSFLPLTDAENIAGGVEPELSGYPEMLSVLNEKERDIVVLRVLCDFTLTEIAKQKNMPKGSVFWIYNNSMKKLKKHLKEGGENNV